MVKFIFNRGDLTNARYWYEQAVTEAKATGSHQDISHALGNLGNVYALLEDYSSAEAHYREVLEIQRIHQSGNEVGATLVNLGNLKADAGHPEQAIAYYLEAIDVLVPLDNHHALGILYSNLAL